METDTRLAELESEMADARQQAAGDLEAANKRVAAREAEIEVLKKAVQEREGLVSVNEKMDRELKHGKVRSK